jgi:hypothetical protein
MERLFIHSGEPLVSGIETRALNREPMASAIRSVMHAVMATISSTLAAAAGSYHRSALRPGPLCR